MTINYLSVCSGIDSVSVAWHPLGWNCVGLSEIHPFRSAVLNYHYPEIKNFGDFTGIQKDDLKKETYPDLLVGGTPCASFSISGLRKGFEDDRGNLALEFILLAKRLKTSWILWENVPGLLSSDKGRDFGNFLGALAECGYGFAYRVLDAQYTRTQRFPRALPQRRRRVFVVGHLGDWRPPAEVLFDRETLSGNPPPSRKKRKETSRETEEGSSEQIWRKLNFQGEYAEDEVSGTLMARGRFSAYERGTIISYDNPVAVQAANFNSNGSGVQEDGSMYTLTATDRHSVMCFERRSQDGGAPRIQKEEISPTLNAMTGGNRQPCVMVQPEKRQGIVRRLTPLECERLQGFPDNYTQIPYRGKPKEQAPISQRYEACGRAMAVNVMEWLGTRIQMVHKKKNGKAV